MFRLKNLLLDPDAVARGERYSRCHVTSLSRLVSDFLRSLRLGVDESAFRAARVHRSPRCLTTASRTNARMADGRSDSTNSAISSTIQRSIRTLT